MSKYCRWINRHKEIIAIVIAAIAAVIAAIGLWATFLQLKWDAKATRDMYLTGVWNDIMQESIQHPDFAEKAKTLTYKTSFKPPRRIQYETYARWIGGYLEDLHVKQYRKDWPYYEPWVDDMFELHSAWLIDNVDTYKHTKEMHSRLLEMKKKQPNKRLEATGVPPEPQP